MGAVSMSESDKRKLFRKVVAEVLKEINGAVVDDVSDLDTLVGEKIRRRADFCKYAGANAELKESEIFSVVVEITIFCDELFTEIEIPMKIVVDTEYIDENHINIDVDY
jgi:hypothetical protein